MLLFDTRRHRKTDEIRCEVNLDLNTDRSCERDDDGENRGDEALPCEMDLSALGLGLFG